jgi:hypothetical protein
MGTYRTEGFQEEGLEAGARAVAIATGARGEGDTTTTILTGDCRERYRDGKEEEWLGVGDRGRPERLKRGIGNGSKLEDGTGVVNAVAVYISAEPRVGNIGGVGRCGDKGGSDLDTEWQRWFQETTIGV